MEYYSTLKECIWISPNEVEGFRGSSVSKESACNAGDPGLIPGLGKSAGEGIGYPLQYSWASLVAQVVKSLPTMWETWVWPLDWEDPLEKGKATYSSILAWRIPFMGSQRVGHDWATFTSLMKWMKLEPMIQTEVSQKERQILYINSYVWNLERRYQWSYMQGSTGDTDVKNRLLDSVREDEGGMIWENSVETCVLLYAKQMPSAWSMREAGHSELVLWDNPEGQGGEGGERGV